MLLDHLLWLGQSHLLIRVMGRFTLDVILQCFAGYLMFHSSLFGGISAKINDEIKNECRTSDKRDKNLLKSCLCYRKSVDKHIIVGCHEGLLVVAHTSIPNSVQMHCFGSTNYQLK